MIYLSISNLKSKINRTERESYMKKIISAVLLAATLGSTALLSSCSKSADLADYDLEKYITLGEYKGIKINETIISVTDDDVADAVDDLLDEHADTVELKSTELIKKGDTVKITYTGKINGECEAFEIGHVFTENIDGYELVIGSGKFIDGFEDELIDAYPGGEVTFDIVFPDDYENNEDLRGVNTTFTVKILSAKRDVYPEYTDDFVAENTDYDTIKEYEAALREQLREAADEDELVAEIQAVWEKVVENATVIKYPEAVVEAQIDEVVQSYKEYAEYYGITFEALLKDYYGTTEDEFMVEVEAECELYIKEEMILRRIVELEGITITDAEYAEGAVEYALENGFEDAAALEEYYGETVIKESLLWDKVLVYLVEKADIQPATEKE